MTGTVLVSTDGTNRGASMVKMSVDFPSEVLLCQRISSVIAQITFEQSAIGGFSQGAFCYPLRTIDGSGRVEPFPREPAMTWLPLAVTRPCQRLPSGESPQIRPPVRIRSAFWLDIK